MIPVRFRPEAQAEAGDAATHYEAQSFGLGYESLLELDEAIERVSNHPEGYQVLYRGVRRVPLRRFPYGAFYLVEKEEAVIIAILHLSSDPDAWISRA